jgi:Zn-dependent alcohol dehydrogenase
VLVEAGAPLETWRIEVDDPHEREVRVRMAASGVCHSCLHAADGSHQNIPTPIVLGDEGAGVVEAVGPGCTTLAAGDRVVLSWAPGCGDCRLCARGRPGLCLRAPRLGVMADGTTRFSHGGQPVYHYGPATYAPLTVVAERAAIRVPDDVPLDRAALVGCAVTTGVGGVLNAAGVRPGESVAVFGCGGVGLNAIQGALAVAAHPIIAVDVREPTLALARRLGATATVDAARDDAGEALRGLAPGGVDHAIVAVGDVRAMVQAIESLGPLGRCVVLGNAPTDSPPLAFDSHLLLRGERSIIGSVYGSSNPAVDFPRFLDLYRAGTLKLDELVGRRYTLTQANEAFAALAAGEPGRGLIVFDDGHQVARAAA